MKRIRIIAVTALMVGLASISTDLLAQRPGRGMRDAADDRGMMYNNQDRPTRNAQCILDLTPEQDTKITELRTKHLKEVTPMRNELNEKRAKLRTLQTSEKTDLNAINKTIDEMATLRANIQKKGAAHRSEVSSLLTDDQRVMFNARKENRMGSRGQGTMGRGMRKY
jgi:Spy/CpxP family protein refolding chaperone